MIIKLPDPSAFSQKTLRKLKRDSYWEKYFYRSHKRPENFRPFAVRRLLNKSGTKRYLVSLSTRRFYSIILILIPSVLCLVAFNWFSSEYTLF